MAWNNSSIRKTRFDRAAWWAMIVVAIFSLLALATTLWILALPTDGWLISYSVKPPPPLSFFAGDWSTPLQANDQVLAVNGTRVGGGEAYQALPAAEWRDGNRVVYTVLRGGRQMEIPVTLHRLDAAGMARALWSTMRAAPAEWSWAIIAILVFLLRPRSPAAQLMLLAFVPHTLVTKLVWAATTISHNFAPGPLVFSYLMANAFWGYLFFPAIILLGLSFPLPVFPLTRWPRGLPAGLFGLSLILSLLSTALKNEPLATAVLVSDAVLLLLSFGAALLNTRRLRQNPVARAQAIWVGFGFGLTFVPLLVFYLIGYSGLVDSSRLNSIFANTSVLALVLPACLAIAITRYHLFDIYLIIRRTLQYSLITVLLALVYFGSVVLLQTIFRAWAGQGQDFAIVLSTLAIAGLFNPLRRRVQAFIDRRFFRSKYDAEQILAGFAATARAEVALEPLTLDLLKAVEETMRPEQTSLWLKPGKQ